MAQEITPEILRNNFIQCCRADGGEVHKFDDNDEVVCQFPSGLRLDLRPSGFQKPRVSGTTSDGLNFRVDGVKHFRMHPFGLSTQIGDEEIKFNDNGTIKKLTIIGGDYRDKLDDHERALIHEAIKFSLKNIDEFSRITDVREDVLEGELREISRNV